ncbi:neuroligin-4, X-linked-like [Acanthaster planci]|uniref:Neuroligin-4, X-linked-like n=1 Tax=Acanthaster planci TaxID=133434 RepID=A0A8B7YM49_ACAPL|nr:neuroligin-4, X-linked-like [Acanthaster planci]
MNSLDFVNTVSPWWCAFALMVLQPLMPANVAGDSDSTWAVGLTDPVQVPGGLIRGQRVRLRNRHLGPVEQYLGVPFARPPTGHLRFRPPQFPPIGWSGVRNATKFSPACPQLVRTAEGDLPSWKSEPLRSRWPFLQVMDEDCLFLNIYVPAREVKSTDGDEIEAGTEDSVSFAGDAPLATGSEDPDGSWTPETWSDAGSYSSEDDQPSDPPGAGDQGRATGNGGIPLGDDPGPPADGYPVMVFIHGDGFREGSGNMYDGSVLASYGGVIVVTFNYRLGILGFLSTNDGAARGNYGLLDQILVLKWINQNIRTFGGDPNHVTVFGVGSGAACAGMLMVSNMTSGLISGVIAHSGSAIAPWAITREPRNFAKMAATKIGCEAPTTYQIVDCLRQVRPEEFQLLDVEAPLYYNAFAPVVDGGVLEDDPAVLFEEIARGERRPSCTGCAFMTGVTRSEGFAYVGEDADGAGKLDPMVFNHILDGFVQNNYGGNMHAGNVIKKAIYYEYIDWGGGEGNPFTLSESAIDIISDDLWVTPAIQSLKMTGKMGLGSYLYTFGHRSKMDVHPRWAGSVHLSDMPFIFGAPLVPGPLGIFMENFTKGDASVSLAVLTYWTNFAKTGNPNMPVPQTPRKIHRHYKVSFPYETLEPWPAYTEGTQEFIHIGISPRIRDFYRLHKISFWEELVPEISKAFPADVMPPYVIPTLPALSMATTTAASDPLTTQAAPRTTVKKKDTNKIPGNAPTASPAVSPTMGNEIPLGPVKQDEPSEGNFTVELSVVIAVGGFLLLVNVLVLGAIYYMRDRRKLETKLAAKYLAQQEERRQQQKMSEGAGSRLAAANNHGTASPAHRGLNQNMNRNNVTFGNDVIEFQV